MASTPQIPPSGASHAPLDEHDALPAGTRFGELEILRVLGIGGFGIVYLAQDHALERQVALKEYMPSSLAGRGKGQMVSVRSGAHTETYALGLRSFVNEARLLARFNHPSLVKVYRFWEENGTAYMVMPFLQGRTLRDVRRSMPTAPSEGWIRSVIDPMLDALDLLHREDVYHRDIAPDNIFLPPGELPVLLDFGAARRAIGDSTQTFTAILKPSYAPIEQYAEVVQLRQGPWTDLYALGAVTFYLLRGAPPPPATARAVQDDESLLIAEENPGISPQFLAAVEWALAIRPADRPQSIAALREVIEGRAAVPPRGRTGTTVPQRAVIMPPADPLAAPIDGQPLDSAAMEQTRPMTLPPVRVAPRSPPAWESDEQTVHQNTQPITRPGSQARQRTRPDVTVMPLRPTIDTPPASHRRRGAWVVAGIALVVVVGAMAAWVSGSRPVASSVAGVPPAASAPADPAAPTPRAVVQGAEPTPTEKSVPAAAVALPSRVAPNAGAAVVRTGKPLGAHVAGTAGIAEPPHVRLKDRLARPDEALPNPVTGHREERAAERHPGPLREDSARATSTNVHPVPPVPTGLLQGPASPREACGSRVFLALAVCMEEQCELPRFQSHRQCVKVREMVERRRRSEGGG